MISYILKWLKSGAPAPPTDWRTEAAVFEHWVQIGEPMADEVMREISSDAMRDRYSAELTLWLIEVLGRCGGENELVCLRRLIDLPARSDDQKRIQAAAQAILSAVESRAEADHERETLLRPASSETEGAAMLLRPAADAPAKTDKLLRPAEQPDSGQESLTGR